VLASGLLTVGPLQLSFAPLVQTSSYATACRPVLFNLCSAAVEPSANVCVAHGTYAMIQVSILLQQHRTVVANFVPGNFGLFRRNPWKPFAEPWLKNTVVDISI